jgi:hypothetical protein
MSSGTLITLHHVARGIGRVSVIAFIFDYPDHLYQSVLRISKLELDCPRYGSQNDVLEVDSTPFYIICLV